MLPCVIMNTKFLVTQEMQTVMDSTNRTDSIKVYKACSQPKSPLYLLSSYKTFASMIEVHHAVTITNDVMSENVFKHDKQWANCNC